jgi:hypothetical protein
MLSGDASSPRGHVDWHQVAELVRRGCPPRLVLRIVGEAVLWPAALPRNG